MSEKLPQPLRFGDVFFPRHNLASLDCRTGCRVCRPSVRGARGPVHKLVRIYNGDSRA